MSKKHPLCLQNSWQFTIVEYVSYILAVLVPLFISTNHWYPFVTPKAFTIIGGVLLVLVFWGWGIVQQKESLILRFTWIHVALLAWLVVLFASAFSGIDVKNSLFGGFILGNSLILITLLAVFSCCIAFCANNNQRFLRTFIQIVFVSGLIAAATTYSDLLISGSRGGGVFGNTSYAGGYLLVIICLGFYLFFTSKKLWQKIVYSIGIVGIVASPIFLNHAVFSNLGSVLKNPILFVGQANAAVLGLVVAVISGVALFFATSSVRIKKNIGSVAFVAILAGIVCTSFVLTKPETQLHQSITQEKSSNRFLFWDIANQGFIERPLLGFGYGNYSQVYQRHFSSKVFTDGYYGELWVNQPHSTVFEYLSTTGIIGLVIYLGLFGVLLVALFLVAVRNKDRRILAVTLMAALIGFFVQNLFGFDTPTTFFIFFAIIGCTMVLCRDVVLIKNITISGVSKKIVGAIMVLVGIAMIYPAAIAPWIESNRWSDYTKKVFQGADYPQKLSWVGNNDDKGVIYVALAKTLQEKISDRVVFSPTEVMAISNFIEHAEYDVQNSTKDYSANYGLGILITMMNVVVNITGGETNSNSETYLRRALSVNPLNPDVYLALAQMYVFRGDLHQTQNYLRTAFAVAPNYNNTYQAARGVLKIQPTTSFKNYFLKMESLRTRE